jgi:hypothetical protein
VALRLCGLLPRLVILIAALLMLSALFAAASSTYWPEKRGLSP